VLTGALEAQDLRVGNRGRQGLALLSADHPKLATALRAKLVRQLAEVDRETANSVGDEIAWLARVEMGTHEPDIESLQVLANLFPFDHVIKDRPVGMIYGNIAAAHPDHLERTLAPLLDAIKVKASRAAAVDALLEVLKGGVSSEALVDAFVHAAQ